MLAAYAYAAGWTKAAPGAYRLARLIERYGAPAILDRPLTMREINHMQAARSIVDGYRAMHASGDWARWGDKHPDLARLINGLHLEAKAAYA